MVVQVGSNGVTQGVIGAATQALKDHELIKVKIADERDGRAAAVAALAKGTGAEVAQTLGRTVLLFKKRSKNSKFEGILKLVASEEPVTPASLDEEDDSDDLPVALDAAEAAAPPQEVEAEDQEAEDDEGPPEQAEVPGEPTEAPAPKAKAVKKTKPKVAAKAKAAPKKAKPKSAQPKVAARPRAARTPKPP